MRLIIASILAGLVMFMWGALSHMVLGIGEAGVKPMPNDAAMTAAMKANLTEPGFYIMPGIDMTKNATDEEKAAWAARYREGPTAILVYSPTGEEVFTPKQFVVELASNIAAALVVGMILVFASVSFGRGVIISTLVGFAGWLSINVSYWNWYRFPTNFITGELIDQIASWLLAGFVLGWMLRRRV